MKTIQPPTLRGFVATLSVVGSVSCRSLPPQEDSSEQDRALILADSEVFQAVVRVELARTHGASPNYLANYRWDSRPYGTGSGFPVGAAGSRGLDPTPLFRRADSVTESRIRENRNQVLKLNGVREEGPFSHPRCGGVLQPPPPPGSPPSANSKSECPKAEENYISIGLPVRGLPDALRKVRTTRGKLADLTGDVWTVVVDERHAGPGGQNWMRYAWLFKRNSSNGRLELADTILLEWAE